MYQKRSCVFETNSSSTHTICITSDRRDINVIPTSLRFKLGDFNWQIETYDTPEAKASYLYTSIFLLFDQKKANEIKNKLFDMLWEEGCKATFEKPSYEEFMGHKYLEHGNIDHCGEDDHLKFVEAVIGNKHRLLRYLFSDKSFVWTGNDNEDCCAPQVDYRHEKYDKWN